VLWASVGFGQTTDTIGGTAAQAGNQTGLIVWEPITASHSGALNTIGINIPMGFVAGHVVLAIYAASGGPPGTPTGTPLATTTSTLVVAGWMDLATTAFNIVAGTPYFLDQFDNTSGVVNLDSSGTEYYQAQAMYGTWAAPLESIKCKQRCKICE
jgi:hypothetical protein